MLCDSARCFACQVVEHLFSVPIPEFLPRQKNLLRHSLQQMHSQSSRNSFSNVFAQVHMDPHNDVRADVDYQAVLSHMNIHKGKGFSLVPPSLSFCSTSMSYFVFLADDILHNHEASAKGNTSSTMHGHSIRETDHERAAMTCKKSSSMNVSDCLSLSLLLFVH